jgi:hypothetical protein
MGLIQLFNSDPKDLRYYHNNQDPKFTDVNNQNPREIPFGNDRPGGGSSKQPYIKKGLLNDTLNPSLYNDFVLRGGILAPLSAAEDVARLTKYFGDINNPQGLLFAAKQNLLSRTGTKTEASKGIGYANGALNEGAYTPLSTLAEAGIVFAGGHLNKQGIDPTGLIPGLGIKTYQDVISENQLNPNKSFSISDNRLTSLQDSIIFSIPNLLPFNGVKGYNLFPNPSTLISYDGGAGSNLGVGKTNIKFATSNNGTTLKSLTLKTPSFNNNKSTTSLFSTWDYQQITLLSSLNLDSDTKDDFRETISITNPSPNTKSYLASTPGYSQDFEKRFNLTGKSGVSPGSRLRDRSNPSKGSTLPTLNQFISRPLDSVNAYPIYKSEFKDGSRYGKDGFEELNDIIEFSIAILNNDDQNDPKNGISGLSYRKYMHFRAFIDNISDSYDADWNAISYMGRGEKFYKYGGFERKMSLGFTVTAQSKDELNVMYDKLNFLASSLAPEYLDSLTSGYMCGNMAYITLGDYINDQPGIITSLTFDIPEESPWEINRDTQFASGSVVGGTVRQLPHMIKVSLNFIPIHKFRPSKQTWKNDFTRKGEGIATSTVLADPGNQRYIDPNNPFNGKNTTAEQLEIETRIGLQNQLQMNQLVQSPADPSITLGAQSGVIGGLPTSNTIYPG